MGGEGLRGGMFGGGRGATRRRGEKTARRRHIRDESARDARRTSREVTMTSSTSCPSTPFPRVSTSRRRSAAWVSARAALGVPATLARDSIAATAWRCRPSPPVASRASRVAEPSSPSILDNDSVGDDTGGSPSDETTGAGAPARFFALPFAIASASHDRWTNDDAGQQKASVVGAPCVPLSDPPKLQHHVLLRRESSREGSLEIMGSPIFLEWKRCREEDHEKKIPPRVSEKGIGFRRPT